MPVLTEKGSALADDSAKTKHLQLLVNFCRTVVRSDHELLQTVMDEYEQFLAFQARTDANR